MEKKLVSLFCAAVIMMSHSGCATIVCGKTEDVMIRSNPPGAKVKIDEFVSGTTPMMANLVRKKRHIITISKEGHEDVVQNTTRGFNGWYIGNIIFGGIIGLIVDPITGAMWEVEQKEINVTLPEK